MKKWSIVLLLTYIFYEKKINITTYTFYVKKINSTTVDIIFYVKKVNKLL